MKVRRLSAVAGAVAVMTAGACTNRPPVNRPVPVPQVSGPVTGGKLGIPFTSMPEGMAASAGYTENEFFVSGTATQYSVQGRLTADGKWKLQGAGTAPYRSRVVVRRPADPAKFSGNVIVEWFNVTGGVDVDADFGFLHPEIFRAGDAYVGVSAQKQGVDGAALSIGGIRSEPLKTWDPQRYGTLNHPGDRYSYDIFSQVGAALRAPGSSLLGGLEPRKVIGAGESQSAGRLISYIDGVHPLAKVYDGYLVHSRFANGAGFDPVSSLSSPAVHVRADLGVPVLQFVTETDLVNLNFKASREPDTDKLRTWEVTGTAHADQDLLNYQGKATSRTVGPIDDPAMGCKDINDGPQRFVVRRAWADLKTWVGGGAAPAKGDPITMTGNAFTRDPHGNALGGIRTPAVDVPIAAHSGLSGSGSGVFCFLFGSTKPFDAATLRSLYPTHDDYVAKVTASADQTVTRGFIAAGEAAEIIAAAQAAKVPS
jgi:hypothetical protein